MELRIMGALEVLDGTRDRTPTAPKHRDLLAVFALNPRRPMTVARLGRLLWPEEDGERSDSLIRGYVGQLRQLIGKDLITTVSGTYTLAIDEDQLDVHRFRQLAGEGLRAARRGQDEQAHALLSTALQLWRGPVLEDVDPDGHRWTETRRLREELDELRLLAVERRIDLDLKTGRHREVLSELRLLAESHPLWQRFRGQYMLALFRSGRRVDALDAYAGLRDVLSDGHAIDPDPELQLLYHRLLHDDASLHVSAGAPVLVPYDVADFTGRGDLLGLVDGLIGGDGGSVRIVVHGQAGVGKSALAVHAAWRHRERFPDGILYADLRSDGGSDGGGDRTEPVDPISVLEDFLRWLGCPAQAMPAGLEQRMRLLRAYTANRRLLLLLDNASAESQVRPLLTSCPTIITSRSTLGGLTDAVRLPVGVLPEDDAVDLLVQLVGKERATADRSATQRLGRFCGGLPIALRIAGSRLAARPAWPVGYLVGLLEDEHRRLDLLHAGDQTIRSVYSIGYEGLPESGRRLLRLLGALSAPDFANWVAALFGDEAETLVEAGLLETNVVDVAGQARYRLHDLTRLYARERLVTETGEDAVRRALADLSTVVMTRVHASRFSLVSGMVSGVVSSPSAAFSTTDIRDSVTWLIAERVFLVSLVDDLHKAALWDDAWRLVHLLTPFFERHRFLDDWRRAGELALDAARRAQHTRGEALILRDLGDLHRAERQWEPAHDRLRHALSMFLGQGDTRDVAHTRRRLGQVHLARGRLAEAERNLTLCLAAFDDRADIGGVADARAVLGAVFHRAGRFGAAAVELEAAATLHSGLGDRHKRADALLELAEVRLAQHQISEAREAAQEARSIAVRLDDRLLGAQALVSLAELGLAEGQHGHARQLAEEALETFQSAGDDQGQSRAHDVLGRAATAGP